MNNILCKILNENSIKISWESEPDYGYKLYYDVVPEGEANSVTLGNAKFHILRNLRTGVTYFIHLRKYPLSNPSELSDKSDWFAVPLRPTEKYTQPRIYRPISGIAFPFSSDGKGSIRVSKGLRAIKEDIINELLTEKGERFYRPNQGGGVESDLFEKSDELVLIEKQRAENILNNDKRISKYSVDVEFRKEDRGDAMEERVLYIIINIETVNGEVDSFAIRRT